MILLLQMATSWVHCTTDTVLWGNRSLASPDSKAGPAVLLNLSSTDLEETQVSLTMRGKTSSISHLTECFSDGNTAK